jgi:hypothetical protein
MRLTMLPTPGRTEQSTFRLPRQAGPADAFDRIAHDLATELDGRLVRPEDAGWDEARSAWHLDVDQRPEAVVMAETVSDIVAV